MKRSVLFTSLGLGAAGLAAALSVSLLGGESKPSNARELAPASSGLHGTAASVVAAPIPPPSTSPETERLEARRQLYEAVDAFVQASEFEKARKLLDEDVQRNGDDLAPEWHDLEQSYRLIADCLEHPSPKLRVRAEAFVLVSQALSLKSRIRTACAPQR